MISHINCESSSIIGFRPYEVTHGSSGHCSHLNNKKSYHIKKYDVEIKNEKGSGFFSSLFSSLQKYILNQEEVEENKNKSKVPLEQPFEVEYKCLSEEKYCDRIKSSFEKIPDYFTRAL
eukprot:jgi/Orpsp1_1/1176934/evm.model.c7180000059547.1